MTDVADLTSIYQLLRPSPGQAKVFVFDSASGLGDWCSQFLTATQHEACQQYHQSIDRQTIAAMRGLWKLGAGVLGDVHPGQIEIQRSAYGRPFIGSKNVQYDLNVSRTGSWCGIVLSHAGACGIDLEAIDPSVVSDQLLDMLHVAKPDRSGFFENPKTFFEYWTCIEAALKADGRGLADGFRGVSCLPSDRCSGRKCVIDSKTWSIRSISLPAGIVGCCAFGDDGVEMIGIDACALSGMI